MQFIVITYIFYFDLVYKLFNAFFLDAYFCPAELFCSFEAFDPSLLLLDVFTVFKGLLFKVRFFIFQSNRLLLGLADQISLLSITFPEFLKIR